MFSIGVDLGGTNIAIGICDKEMNMVAKGSVKTEVSGGTSHIMDNMAGLIETLLSENNISKKVPSLKNAEVFYLMGKVDNNGI